MKKFLNLFIFILIVVVSIQISSACCTQPKVEYKNGIYHIILDGKTFAKKIQFISCDKLISNQEIHEKTKSKLTINTGFFDPKNQKTISYIVSEMNTVAEDPVFNENLMSNSFLRKNLDKILNRTEFRVLECDGKYSFDITPHNTPLEFQSNIITSAQGGPMLLPDLRLEEEFFVVKNSDGKVIRDSISALHKCARTIIGIKDGDVHILVITNENPMTLPQVRDYCKELGFEKAMAFDGGSSTSLNYKKINVVSTKSPSGRLLKSFMIIR